MIIVKVVGRDGHGVSGIDVKISWRGYSHSTGQTNISGQISWDVSSGSGIIYVNGKQAYDGQISGTVTIQKP